MAVPARSPRQVFEDGVDRTPTATGCWLWRGKIDRRTGYGQAAVTIGYRKRRHLGAHQLSYEIHHGPRIKGMHVMHSCDNRPCVNPAHLSLGTPQQNSIDCWSKGRHPVVMANLGKRKAGQWEEARRLHGLGLTDGQIAQALGLKTRQAVSGRLREMGLPPNPAPPAFKSPEAMHRALDMSREGHRVTAIARHLGAPLSTVRRWLLEGEKQSPGEDRQASSAQPPARAGRQSPSSARGRTPSA